MAGLPVRRAPYKDFLQPALQRRFASTAAVLLAVSYIEAVALGDFNSFLWSWFPLGPTGLRALFIFVCGLAILILRIAHYHVGLRTTGSGVRTTASNLAKPSTYETVFWYCLSSFVFCPVILSSLPESANLSWVTYFSGDRARVNERTIFLACYLGICAIIQCINHFVYDADHLDLGAVAQRGDKKTTESKFSVALILGEVLPLLQRTAAQATCAWVAATLVYFVALRAFAYGWTLMVLRRFYNLPKTNILPTNPPFDIYLIARCLVAGTFLFTVWAAGNVAFSTFMVKEPLKNGKPLTVDSKDPNGSLLNGLKSKKLSIQCFAMWELSHIAQNFEDRRKAIYTDIDRKEGPMWSQVYAVCMDLIRGMETRAENYGKPPVAPPQPPADEPRPRLAAPLRNEPILNPSAPNAGAGAKAREVAKIITSGSQSSTTPLSELSPLAKKTWNQTKDHVLTKDQQEAMSPENVRGKIKGASLWLMSFGWFRALFQQSFRADFAGTVLGTPHAEPLLYIEAVNALCQLAVHSLGEDQFGNVHRDVPSIIRSLTTVIRKIEDLKEKYPVHWTDPASKKECPEVEMVLDAMRHGLSQVVASFEPFCHDLRLTQGDLRHAKEASIKPEPAPEPIPQAQPPPQLNFKSRAAPRKIVQGETEPSVRRRASRPEMEEVTSRNGSSRR